MQYQLAQRIYSVLPTYALKITKYSSNPRRLVNIIKISVSTPTVTVLVNF